MDQEEEKGEWVATAAAAEMVEVAVDAARRLEPPAKKTEAEESAILASNLVATVGAAAAKKMAWGPEALTQSEKRPQLSAVMPTERQQEKC